MNIIKSVCLLCKDKKGEQLKDLLQTVLQAYISKFSGSNPSLASFLDHFGKFRPSLHSFPSTEVELNTQASDSKLDSPLHLLDKKANAIPLKTKKRPQLPHEILRFSIDSQKVVDFSQQEIKCLLKVFTLLNSKKIKILILLMENKDLEVRRLSIVFFQVLLNLSKSKVHFVEKCALGYSPGLYCLTRLKYLQQKGAAALDLLFLIEQIKGYVKTMVTKIKLEGCCIYGRFKLTFLITDFFWYYEYKFDFNGVLSDFRKTDFYVFPVLDQFVSAKGDLQYKGMCDPLNVLFGFYVQGELIY
jgi:hypothetical protein